uniref:Peptidase aspartic putative domain-containing protein n=1 Tax=Parascaris equorum TaxID=6256 RepID=A0A914S6J2_PAREQ
MQPCCCCHNRNHSSLLCMGICELQEKEKNGKDQPLSPEEVIAPKRWHTFGDSAPQIIHSNRTVSSVQLQSGTHKAVRVSTIKRFTNNPEDVAENVEAHLAEEEEAVICVEKLMADDAKEIEFANQHSSEQVDQISSYWNIDLLCIRDSSTEHEDQQAMD